MNEKAVQDAIWRDRGRQNALMCPNYTPADWWECDVWMVTKAGYAVEFEIKVSVADFRADSSKERQFYENRDKEGATFQERWISTLRKKHEMLAAGDPRGPSRFYFVLPLSLGLTAEQVPTWAGLMTFESRSYESWSGKRVVRQIELQEVKKAPKLHQVAVKDKVLSHCRGIFFYRYWNLRVRLKSEDMPVPDDTPIEGQVAA